MRLWVDTEHHMLTDEQLLRLIAYYGSLEEAATHGNIALISDSSPDARQNDGACSSQRRTIPRRRLADYLEDKQ